MQTRFVFRQIEHGVEVRIVQRVSQTRPDCRIQLLIKHHCREVPTTSTFPAGIASTDEPTALVPKQDGGGTPLAVINPSPIEEIRKESSSRVTASDELCLTEKAGVTGIEGNNAFPFSASAIRCTASLRTIVIHLGLRGVIPLSPNHALTALSTISSLPTCREGCPATVVVQLRRRSSAVLACCTQLLQCAHDCVSHP